MAATIGVGVLGCEDAASTPSFGTIDVPACVSLGETVRPRYNPPARSMGTAEGPDDDTDGSVQERFEVVGSFFHRSGDDAFVANRVGTAAFIAFRDEAEAVAHVRINPDRNVERLDVLGLDPDGNLVLGVGQPRTLDLVIETDEECGRLSVRALTVNPRLVLTVEDDAITLEATRELSTFVEVAAGSKSVRFDVSTRSFDTDTTTATTETDTGDDTEPEGGSSSGTGNGSSGGAGASSSGATMDSSSTGDAP